MLSFDIRSLHKAVQVDGQLSPDDPVWEEADARPAGPVRVTGRLSAAGAGRYFFSGRMEGTAALECRRCLVDLELPVREPDLRLVFAETDEETDAADVFPIDARTQEVDLRPAVREQWLLLAPAYALCREACKGICPSCGADLNEGSCDCAPATDARWDALRDSRDQTP